VPKTKVRNYAMQALFNAKRLRDGKLPGALDLQPYPVLSFAGGLNTKSSLLFMDREAKYALRRDELTLCANWIRTASGGLVSRAGYAALNSTAISPGSGDAVIRDMFEWKHSNGTYYLMAHAGNTIYTWDGSTWNSIGTVSTTANLRIHWCLFQDAAVGFAGTNDPMFYDGTTFGTLSGSPPTSATVCASWRNRIYALAGRTLHACALSNRNDWSTENNAGTLPIPIVRGGAGTGLYSFWDRLLVFTDNESFQVVGTSPPTWDLLPINTVYGHQGSPYAVIAGGNDVYYCDQAGVHSLYTTLVQSETGDVEWRYSSAKIEPTWQEIDAANLTNIVAVHDRRRNLIIFLANRLGTTNAEAFVGDYYHHDDEGKPTWTQYSNFPFASAIESRSLQSGLSEVIFGGYDGKVYRHLDSHLDDDGTAIPLLAQYHTDLEVPAWEKTNRWMVLYAQAQSGTLLSNISMDFGTRVLSQSTDLAQATGDLIGSTFTIGESALGTITFIPHHIGIPGFGRVLTINLNISASARVNLGGMIIYSGLRRVLNGMA